MADDKDRDARRASVLGAAARHMLTTGAMRLEQARAEVNAAATILGSVVSEAGAWGPHCAACFGVIDYEGNCRVSVTLRGKLLRVMFCDDCTAGGVELDADRETCGRVPPRGHQ